MEQIGTVSISGTTFYVIFIRVSQILYQAFYSLTVEGNIRFEQLSPLQQISEIQIPSIENFRQISLE